ncbi:MAG: VWA domain-containing protein [Planctomycetaceae bacterium]|nr:VWA domain-containing protein [Planctomycetaceae bacterium]
MNHSSFPPAPPRIRKGIRTGVSAILIVVLLFVFVVCAAMTVDIAYMQLIRTQLRGATDSAALAGAENLARTGSEQLATRAALDYASAHVVAGEQFRLEDRDIVFGRVRERSSGGYDFTAGQTPYNAVQASGRLTPGSAAGPAQLFFARALGHGDFSTQMQAIAGARRTEVCLTLDRSASMAFDFSGREWSYTGNHPLLVDYPGLRLSWRYFVSPPHPSGSRWSSTRQAVELFLQEVGKSVHRPRVGLVTWASESALQLPPFIAYRRYPAVALEVPLPAAGSYSWEANSRDVLGALDRVGSEPLIGQTNMSAGLQSAIAQLESASSSKFASKVIVLLSDGRWKQGRNPILMARQAREKDITIHCVSLLSDDVQTMQQIASITGGRMFTADSEQQLRDAFAQLARELPVSLTQ